MFCFYTFTGSVQPLDMLNWSGLINALFYEIHSKFWVEDGLLGFGVPQRWKCEVTESRDTGTRNETTPWSFPLINYGRKDKTKDTYGRYYSNSQSAGLRIASKYMWAEVVMNEGEGEAKRLITLTLQVRKNGWCH